MTDKLNFDGENRKELFLYKKVNFCYNTSIVYRKHEEAISSCEKFFYITYYKQTKKKQEEKSMYQAKEKNIERQLQEKEKNSSIKVFNERNKILITGRIQEEFEYSHQQFYRTKVKLLRPSGKEDIIPVVVTQKLLLKAPALIKDKLVEVAGTIRGSNARDENGKNHLEVFLLATTLDFCEEKDEWQEEDEENENVVYLEGVVCNEPRFHVTYLAEKPITAFLLSVYQKGRRSDYIPCIACGSSARLAQKLNMGDKIKLYGRLYSRVYFKPLSPNSCEGIYRTVYEVYINFFTPIG
jgi:hypothetical protein